MTRHRHSRRYRELAARYEKIIQFIKYCLVGVLNTLVTLGVIYMCKSLLGWNLYVSNALGYICGVVNTIGTLTGGGIVGAILFIVIFAAGHALNMAINALGAYVHSARLQYVEFFGKYYESGGKKFDPLRAKTKYVNVMEEK